MREMRHKYKDLVGTLWIREYFESIGIERMIILKFIFEK
jgi:hypothetical protein